MGDLKIKKHPPSTKKTIAISVIATLIVAGSIEYFTGFLMPVTKRTSFVSSTDREANPHIKHKGLFTCGMHPWIISEEPGTCPICGMKLTPKRDDADNLSQKREGSKRKIAYWRAPMNPAETYDKPGKSAMGMDLVPVYEDEIIGGIYIKVDPIIQQNMGIRTVKAKKGKMVYTIRTYGHITYDEKRITEINPKFSGWFEKLYVNFTGQTVQKGEPLFAIYSPELLTAQEEYLIALKNYLQNPSKTRKTMLASVKKRLSYFDIPKREIQAIEKSGIAKRNITIYSAFTGVVIHKNAIQGGYVKAGTPVYKIVDLNRVWVEAHIYEYELDLVHTGLDAEMKLSYLPGKVFNGKVTYVYPYLQQKTRDVVIRLEFDNTGLKLKPEMYAEIKIKTIGKTEGTIIPSESVIRSGERNIVFIKRDNRKFIPRNVTIGMQVDGGNVQVLTGIMPGENIVISGQFLLDSESKLKEVVQKMLSAEKTAVNTPDKADDDFFKEIDTND